MEFYDLDCWKKSHSLTLEIYKITKDFPKSELFALTDQMRRASSSISANIAEGYGRYHYADKIKFFHQARGSTKEIQSFLFLCRDLEYIGKEPFTKLYDISFECEKLVNGMIKYYETKKSP